jgi:hypothetical protein
MKRLALFCLTLFIVTAILAQDKIYPKKGSVIKAKVIEIGVDEIKYKLFDDPDGPVHVVEKDRVLKIEYENGRKETYVSNLKDPELYADQRKNALKINFLSPLFGHTQLSFEHSMRPGRSFEITASLIGLGKSSRLYFYNYDNQTVEYRRSARGLGVGAGYKFIKVPDFITKGIKYSHLLQGFYVKPNFYAGVYGQNVVDEKNSQLVIDRQTVFYGSLQIELGKQLILGEKVTFDFYFGLGYALDNIKDDDEDYYANYHFSVIRGGEGVGLAASGGLRFGILLR